MSDGIAVDSDMKGNLLIDMRRSQRWWIGMSQGDGSASGVLRRCVQTGTMNSRIPWK